MYSHKKINSLLHRIEELEKSVLLVENENGPLLKHIHPAHRESARNLLHYLAIRTQDLRSLQAALSDLAISSIGHSESYTLCSLKKIKRLLYALAEKAVEIEEDNTISCKESNTQLKNNSEALLGRVSFPGETKIMVTLATECGENYEMVQQLVESGMQIARINTAHDKEEIWEQMIANVKKAAHASSKHVRIYMDLEGPKIRTGKIRAANHSADNAKAPSILLYKDSKLTLTKEDIEGHGGAQPVIALTMPEIFDHVKCKEHIWFDDGKIGGIITSKDSKNMVVEITHAPEEGFKLKAEKGVNFPESDLDISAFTKEDKEHLHFIAKHADMVGYSFVQKPEDIVVLQKHLKHLDREDMGIILKIETHMAFGNFPALLFAVMHSRYCGVMIARGDLAVDIGYLRIAEVQEEILWIAEAAHIPVIWATQVLETQIKKGIATRAEISDVVKSVRAECVMLNKGPYLVEAMETIKDIDKRMAAHEDKKRKILRSLHVAKSFLERSE